MNRVHGLLLTSTLALAAFGCGNVVTTAGSNDTGGSGGAGGLPVDGVTTGTSTGGGGPVQSNDIAVTNGDKLEVALATYPQTCGLDNFPSCGPSDAWQVRFDLPVSGLTPGAVVKLQDANGFESGSGAKDAQGVCSGGGGSYWDGTVTVLSVAPTEVHLRLAGTGLVMFGAGTADGDYTVELCGTKPPPGHALSSAIATPSSAVAGNLTIYANNLPSTCADPNNNLQGCNTTHKYVDIELPPALQAIGTYPLDSIATASEWTPDNQGSCSGGGGSYWGGTIQITSIDASSVAFTLSGTDAFFSGGENADGSYVAPRCQ